MGERRRASRVLVNLPVRYSAGSMSWQGRVANLSRNGLFIKSASPDEMGTQVVLAVSFPNDTQSVEIEGKVARVVEGDSGSGMGIRFLGIAAGVRRKLANFMIEQSYQATL